MNHKQTTERRKQTRTDYRTAQPQTDHRAVQPQTDRRAALLGWGIRFFMAAALAGNQIPGGYAPFALGSVAASGTGSGGFAALLGAASGAYLFMDFSDALPFLASCVLILAAASAFRGSRKLMRPKIVSLCAAGLFLSVGLIYAADAPDPRRALIPCIAAAGLTGCSTWFLWPLLHPGGERRAAEGLIFLTACVLLSLQSVQAAGLSLGRMLLCVLLVYTSYHYGAAAGTATGLCLGLMTDLCAGNGNGLFAAALGMGGLLCGRYSGGLRHRAALAFLSGTVSALFLTEDPMADPLLIECAAGMLLFLLLPEKLFSGKRVLKPEPSAGTGHLRERLTRTAAALRTLYENCGPEEKPVRENPAVIFDRAAERVCRRCGQCRKCWKTDYAATFRAMRTAAPKLLARGQAESEDFPAEFTAQCRHLTEYLSAVDTEVHTYLLRQRYQRELAEARRDARGQYAQFADLLSSAAGEEENSPKKHGNRYPDRKRITHGSGISTTDERFNFNTPEYQRNTGTVFAAGEEIRVGTALRPRRGQSVCGDTAEAFRTEDGIWCLMLADGMGSGTDARRESALNCRLLRQFLEAGVQPEAALETLNTAMALRGAETGSFTAMDLGIFDPENGELAFYKYGAAPSYLKKGTHVERISGAGLPVGLRKFPAPPDVTRMRLESGSFAVMVSDGVAETGQDAWLEKFLSEWIGNDPQELAGEILKESVRRHKAGDDCGIQILYCPPVGKMI